MVKRAGSNLLLLAVCSTAVFGGALGMLFASMIVAVAAAGELYRLLRRPDVLPAVSAGLASIVALGALGYARGSRAPESFPFVIAAVLFLSFVVMLLRRDRANVTRAVASTLLPVVAVGLPAAYAVVLRSAHDGFTVAWVFVMMATLTEAGASNVTSFVRRRALTPRARRTWEHFGGAAGGALIAAVIAVASASPPFTWARALSLAGLVALTVSVGDLAWEMVEDDLARAEQSARRRPPVLPHVGGVLLAAPVFFYVFRALHR